MGIYNLGGGGGAPELQAKEATPLITNAQQIIVPDEGYDGISKVTVNPMPTGALKTPTVNSIGYVSAGVQTAGYLDTSATSGLQLSTQAAKTITPTTYSQTAVASGKYTTGAVTVAGDSDLVASNIKSGVNIFGVTGSYAGSGTFKNVTVQSNPSSWSAATITIPIPSDTKKITALSFYYSDSNGNYASPNNPTVMACCICILGQNISPNMTYTIPKTYEVYGSSGQSTGYSLYMIENPMTANFSNGLLNLNILTGAYFGKGYHTFCIGLE